MKRIIAAAVCAVVLITLIVAFSIKKSRKNVRHSRI